jgi:hypothetical protein
MTLHQILGILSYPVEIVIEKEKFMEVFPSESELISQFKGYAIQQIRSNHTNQLTVELVKIQSLEELGYSFESGV